MITVYEQFEATKGDMMNSRVRYYCCALLFCIVQSPVHAVVVPYLSFRSQGINGAREIVGWQTQINRFDCNTLNGSFSVTPEVTRSFRAYQLAQYLFCDALAPEEDYAVNMSCCRNDPMIRVEGTKAPNRHDNAIMAENFYLPTDYSSHVYIHPTITNAIVDFNLYLGLDNIIEGLFFRIHTPLCYTRWYLDMHEHVINKGTNNYDAGYFNDTYTGSGLHPFQDPKAYGIARSALLGGFKEYIQYGASIHNTPEITYHGLNQALVSKQPRTETGLAEITAALGLNVLSTEDYHFGFNVRGAVPTGNRPRGHWLFEPIVGNGHHWELGAGISGHVCLGRGEGNDKDLSLYVDAYCCHMFGTRQCRTFDLCGKPLSRYMLAMKFTNNANDLYAENVPMPYAQAKEFIPVANITTIPVNVSILCQGEVVLKMAYTVRDLSIDLGYSVWARSSEQIKTCDLSNINDHLWALKGDAFVFGFPGISVMPGNFVVEQPAIPLGSSQSKATIFKGTNGYPNGISLEGTQVAWNQNPGIDNAKPAYTNAGTPLYTHAIDATGSLSYGWDIVGTSSLPIFFSSADLGVDTAGTKSYSQKFFMHINYTNHGNSRTPYIGIGAELEFGDSDRSFECSSCVKNRCSCTCSSSQCPGASCCKQETYSCENNDRVWCSLSQWGIWIKGGFSFD
jgi:hypothetical protein